MSFYPLDFDDSADPPVNTYPFLNKCLVGLVSLNSAKGEGDLLGIIRAKNNPNDGCALVVSPFDPSLHVTPSFIGVKPRYSKMERGTRHVCGIAGLFYSACVGRALTAIFKIPSLFFFYTGCCTCKYSTRREYVQATYAGSAACSIGVMLTSFLPRAKLR